MRNGFVWASIACALMTLSSRVSGQPPSSGPVVLWYRSSEGCPDWADFLVRLGDRASLVRPAEVGDRVDFVVNIAMTPAGACGRLERQTETGTVAIREVEEARCERVADVVALNLALALDPERPAPKAQVEPNERPRKLLPLAEARPASPAMQLDKAGKPAVQTEAGLEAARWRVGLQAGVLGAVNPEVLARGTAFVEYDARFAPLPHLTVRAALVAAFGTIDGCCFDYGNAETSTANDGNGAAEALYFGHGVIWGTGSGDGPWVMADLENGLYPGWENGGWDNISTNQPLEHDFVTAVLVGDTAEQNQGKGRFALYGGDAQAGELRTQYDGIRPERAGYVPMAKQGSIVLSVAGDNSDGDGGRFYEGAMVSGAASKEVLNALQAALVAAKYGL